MRVSGASASATRRASWWIFHTRSERGGRKGEGKDGVDISQKIHAQGGEEGDRYHHQEDQAELSCMSVRTACRGPFPCRPPQMTRCADLQGIHFLRDACYGG